MSGYVSYWPGFLDFLINRNWLEARQIQARFYWCPYCNRREQEQVPLLPHSPRWGNLVLTLFPLYGVRVGVCLGIRPEEWLRWFAHPFLGGVVCRGHTQYPVFAPGSSEVALGLFVSFLVSVYLLSRICPKCPCMQLFLMPSSFFVFCCSKTGLSRCKRGCTAAKGPRFQPVS